jgi:hypothetical protein
MITTYPHRPVSRSAPVRRRPVSRRVARDEHWFSEPLPLLAASALVMLLICSGWLGWQVQHHGSVLAGEKMAQDSLVRTNQDLTGQRDRLLARDNIVNRAAALGLYPAGPDQVRKIGGSSAPG